MPSVQTAVIAIACSDLHLSHTPPLARSGEKSWYGCMQRQLQELTHLKEKYRVPILCAGDVFDRWNSTPELINFAIANLPPMWSIAGQHDLPLHNLKDIRKSAYWTLVESGRLLHINTYSIIDSMQVSGFSWGRGLENADSKPLYEHHIALIHKYVWSIDQHYPGAHPEDHWDSQAKKLQGYDFVISGDNHLDFTAKMKGSGLWINCGGFMRRKSDEINRQPKVWLLHPDKTTTPHLLDVSQDQFLESTKAVKEIEDTESIQEFVKELNKAEMKSVDFRDMVIRYMDQNRVGDSVRKVILQSLEK